MRIHTGAIAALLVASSPAAGFAMQGQEIQELKQQLQHLQEKLESLEERSDTETTAVAVDPAPDEGPAPNAGLNARLDEIIRQSPANTLNAPTRFSASALDGVTWDGGYSFRAANFQNMPAGGGLLRDNTLTFDQRLSLGIGGRLSEKSQIYAQLYDARVWGTEPVGGTGIADVNLELAQAYLELTDVFRIDNSPVDFRIGRQKIEHGSERQFGDDEWFLTRTRFDGVTMETTLAESTSIYVHALRLSDGDSVVANEFSPGSGVGPANADLYAFYLSHDSGDVFGTIDLYYIYLNAESRSAPGFDTFGGARTGRSRLSTIGARLAGDQDGVFWDVEAATQFGTVNGNHIDNYLADNWMMAARLGYRLDEGPLRGFYGGYDYVKGGRDGYTQLFPATHGVFGIMDIASFNNIQHFVAAVELSPMDDEDILTMAWHWLRLDNSNAGITNFGPIANSGATGRKDLGQEADIVYTMPCTGSSTVNLGAGIFFPGDAYRAAYNSSRNVGFGFVSWGTSF